MPTTLPVSYTTVSLMLVTFPELGSATTLNSLAMATFAGDAQAEVNAAIVRQYSLPLGEIPILQTLTTEIAIYRTITRRAIPIPSARAQEWVARYAEAREMLAKIATGEIPLVTSGGGLVAGRTDISEIWSTTKDYLPTFHEGPATQTPQDQDKIDALLDERDINTPGRLLD